MALASIPGPPIPWTGPLLFEEFPWQIISAGTIDATGEKFAATGAIAWSGTDTSKSIRTVGFRFGTVTKGGGSALTVSLQNVLASGNGPLLPDETQDQTVAIANANGSFATATWITTGNLSADRTVNYGELLGLVVEYDGAGRLGSDSFTVNSWSQAAAPSIFSPLSVVKTGGAWGLGPTAGVPNIVFGFSDGTFGTFAGGLVTSAAPNSQAFNSGSTPDEYALPISFTSPVRCAGAGGWIAMAAGAAWDLVLYQGTSELARTSVPAYASYGGTQRRPFSVLFATPVDLAAGVQYYLGVQPSTANSVTVDFLDVNAAGHLQVFPGGQDWNTVSRTNAGSWSAATTTRRLRWWPLLSAFALDTTGAFSVAYVG